MVDVSIIIPVYNVEKYILRCLDSIISQNDVQIEVILIDDFSTDKSFDEINKYISISEINSNIKINLLQNDINKGVSYTRNRGIDLAKGKYLFFLDSDDELYSSNSISLLYEEIERTKSQICIGDNLVLKNNKEVHIPYYLINQSKLILDNNIINYYLKGEWPGVVWNKLYDKEIITQNKIYFKEGLNLGEDELWSFTILLSIIRICFVNEKTYTHYLGDNDSSLTKKIKHSSEIFEIIILEILKALENKSININNKPYSEFIKKNIHKYLEASLKEDNWIKKYRKMKVLLKKYTIKLLLPSFIAFFIYRFKIAYIAQRNIRF